jgi:thymidine phosphorylase
MLELAGVHGVDPADVLADGRALATWDAMIRAQGGDPDAELPIAAHRHEVVAPVAGYLQRLDARGVGVAAWRLGAGRSRKEDDVSATAGVLCRRKPGDPVEVGEPVLELHADDPALFEPALAALTQSMVIGPEPPEPRALVVERVS